MKESDIKILEENGWEVICESPFEIEEINGGGTATGEGAELVLYYFKTH